MEAIYPHRWKSAIGPDANSVAGKEWAEALAELTPHQIRRGLKACRDGLGPVDFPPSIPRFRELCFDLPPIAEVRREIGSRDAERTPFGLLVARGIDMWAYRQADAHAAERMLREAYAEARAHVLAGGELPVVLPALTDDTERERPEASPEVVAAALASVREMLDAEPPVEWRAVRGFWVASLRTPQGEARATVTPPAAECGPWRWCVMIAGDVVEAGEVDDGEAAKAAAVRCAAGVTA